MYDPENLMDAVALAYIGDADGALALLIETGMIPANWHIESEQWDDALEAVNER